MFDQRWDHEDSTSVARRRSDDFRICAMVKMWRNVMRHKKMIHLYIPIFFIKSINDRNIYDDAKRKRDVKNVKGICEYSYRFLVRVYTYTPTIAKIWVPCHTVLTF